MAMACRCIAADALQQMHCHACVCSYKEEWCCTVKRKASQSQVAHVHIVICMMYDDDDDAQDAIVYCCALNALNVPQ